METLLLDLATHAVLLHYPQMSSPTAANAMNSKLQLQRNKFKVAAAEA